MFTIAVPLSTRDLDTLLHCLRVAKAEFKSDVERIKAMPEASTFLPTFEHYAKRTSDLMEKVQSHMRAEGLAA